MKNEKELAISYDKYYSIVKFEGKKIVSIFNNRVYLGRYVSSAYTQIPNKEEYTICLLKQTPINMD